MEEAQFNIKIKDYRAISEADIDINGITVLSGVNGCGKSSISFFLYNFLNTLLNFDIHVNKEIYNKIKKPLELIDQLLTEIELESNIAPSIINGEIGQTRLFIDVLLKNLTNDRNKLKGKSSIDSIINNIFDGTSSILNVLINKNLITNSLSTNIERINSIIKNSYLKKNGSNSSDNIIENIESLKNILNNTVTETEKFRNNPPKFFIDLLLSNIYLKKENFDSITIKEYSAKIYSSKQERVIIPKSINETFYIDSPNMLEGYDEFNILGQHKKSLQDKIRTTNNNISNLKNDIASYIHDKVLHGSIEHDEQPTNGDLFKYNRNDGKVFNLSDCATGIKSFAIIEMLYVKGLINSNTLLIIDEPEVHLHPQWVVEYARLVVLLNKHLGVKFLIASHHPEFVSSIRYISEKEKTTDGLNFYIAKEQKNFSYKFESTGTEIDETFNSFNKSFDLIDEYGNNEI